MKKRTVAVVMAAAMTIGMMVTGVSVQAGVEDKTLIVGFDAEYPPFGYKDDNGEYVGFDLDLAQEVCDNLGWELVKKPINWDSKDMELNSGTIDCIWNGFTINGREDDYTPCQTPCAWRWQRRCCRGLRSYPLPGCSGCRRPAPPRPVRRRS